MTMGDWDAKYLGKRDLATGTKSFFFERPPDLDYRPGQYFYVSIPTAGEAWLRHHFSFSSSPTEPDIAFTTRMTGHEFKNAVDELAVGTTVGIEAPFGEFVVAPEMAKVAFVCGGIGITPARSTIRWALDTGAAGRTVAAASPPAQMDILLLYANRDLAGTAFADELAAIDAGGIRVVEIMSEPRAGWAGPTGHIDAAFVKEQAPDWRERYFFVSGPPGMVKALAGVLAGEVGVAADHLITEDFTGYE
jgi:glycine betaine catabolism B